MKHSHRLLSAAAVVLVLVTWFWSSRRPSPDVLAEIRADESNHGAQARSNHKPGSIAGTVRSSAGSALPAARVCAAAVGLHLLGRVDSACALTNAEGRYVIADLPAGAYDLSAIVAEYEPASTGARHQALVTSGRAVDGVDFIMVHGGARLEGTVVDATGGPIEAASLALWFDEPNTRKVTVQTDVDGRFVAWITPGAVGITASANGYAELLVSHVAPSSDLVIRMTPGSTIQGTVVSARTLTPVAGVEVRAVCHHCMNSAGSPSAISGSDGRFTVANLEAASYALSAEGDGFRGHARDSVDVGIARSVSGLLVYVEPVVRVAGQVQLSTGEPCVRGTVNLGSRPAWFTPAEEAVAPDLEQEPSVPDLNAAIEATGEVHFRAVPKGTYYATVQCQDHVRADGPSRVVVADADIHDLLWHVRPGLKLTVHVTDSASKPRPHTDFAMLWPARRKGQSQVLTVYTTDDQGRHESERSLYPGVYEIRAYQSEGDPVSVELREDRAASEATLRLRGSGSIELEVKSPDGKPINALRVTAMLQRAPAANAAEGGEPKSEPDSLRRMSAHQATPLGDGQFGFSSLTPGTYTLEIDDGVNSPTVRNLQVVDGIVRERVVLDLGGTIQGRVVDADGQPGQDLWVTATCAAGQAPEPEAETGDMAVRILRETKRTVSDAAGEFAIRDVSRAATGCTVRAEDPGAATGETQGVTPGRDVVIRMRAFGSLSGTARTTDGRAVEQFMVSIASDRDSRSELVATNAGRWSLARVRPGTLNVSARTATGAVAQQSVNVAPGQAVAEIELQFAPELAAPDAPATQVD